MSRPYSRAGISQRGKTAEARKTTKVITGHAMAVRDNTRGEHKDHKLFNTEITHKEFGADDKGGKEAATWKNRVKDWYNAERRFIFAAKTEK